MRTFLIVVGLAGPELIFAQTSRPSYAPLRYDEDWSRMAATSNQTDYFDRLKYIVLCERCGYLTLGGEARVRYEYFSEFAFGAGQQDSNGYSLQRYLLHADWHINSHTRIFTQIQSAIELGRNGGPRPTDDDRFEIHQAFIDYSWGEDDHDKWTIRIGRHEMDFGAGRLISAAEGLNVRRSFDGIRLIHSQGRWLFNFQVDKLVAIRPGLFNDVPDWRQTFWGAGATRNRGAQAAEAVYYLGLDRKRGVFDKATGREIRHTIGFHSHAVRAHIDYNLDAILQAGRFEQVSATGAIHAWAISADTGYLLSKRSWRPRVSLRTDAASGDGNRSGKDVGTFNPLFPATAYSDTIGLLGASNTVAISPFFRFTPTRSLTMNAGSAFFWRMSTQDGVYGINVATIRTGQLTQDRFVGLLPSLRFDYRLSPHWQATFTMARLAAGGFLQHTPPGESTNYSNVFLTYRF
jgi:hypothetical protein